MRKVCVNRKGAMRRYRGKKVEWIMCKKCVREWQQKHPGWFISNRPWVDTIGVA